MRIAIYLRVSTDGQFTDNQRPDIEAYLRQYPDASVTWFSENESAWRQGHQTELAKLRRQIESGRAKYDLLIVWAFDRLTREGGIALIKQYEFFLRHKVRVYSLKEPWLDVPAEFLPVMLSLAGYLAQMESKRRSERTKAGLERVRKNGSQSGKGIGKRGKDRKPRKKSGYHVRWSGKKTSDKIAVNIG